MSQKIILVEDDIELAELTAEFLEDNGFDVTTLHTGEGAVDCITEIAPACVILDLMLPGKDGLSICRELRPGYLGPVIMLTAKTDMLDQVLGLEVGADDYIEKPVEPRVLLSRVRAILRRIESYSKSTGETQTKAKTKKMFFGDLEINESSREIKRGGVLLEFTNPEYELLSLLARNAGKVLTRDDIYSALRGVEYDGQDRTVDIRVSQIRSKIEEDPKKPKWIKTVRNKGYLFALD